MACDTYSANLYNITYLGSVSASGSAVGSISDTYDGDTDTYWIDNGGSPGLSWLAPEFSTAKNIRKLRLYYGDDYSLNFAPTEFRLEVSSDGLYAGEEIELLDISGLTWTADTWKEWEFDNDYNEKYYRIVFEDSVNGNAAGIFLIELFYCTDVAGGDLITISEFQEFAFEFTGEVLPKPDNIAVSEFTKGVLEFNGDAGDHAENIAVEENTNILLDGMYLVDDQIAISENVDGVTSLEVNIAENIALTENVNWPVFFEIAEAMEIGDAAQAFNWSNWIAANKNKAIQRFFLTLTGEADLTTDLQIPIASFQARKRTANPTYVSAVVPGFDYAGQISDRANGELVISIGYEINGTIELTEEILRATLEEIRTDQGPRGGAISLSGTKTETFATQIATVENSVYRSIQSGNLVHRFAHVDPFLNPGDTCRTGDDEFTVDYIVYQVNSYGTIMEVREG